jgi:hypothetical protein
MKREELGEAKERSGSDDGWFGGNEGDNSRSIIAW